MKKLVFEDYVKLIRKRAGYYSKVHGVEYSDVESEGFLIYCKALESYDPSKGLFSTHLYYELNRLGEYCLKVKKHSGFEMSEEQEAILETSPITATLNDLMDLAKDFLNADAYEVFSWIVNRKWECKGRRIPTLATATSHFGWKGKRMRTAWNDCKSFWNNQGINLY